MDARITKERLNRMLSYDWLKIVGFCLVAIIVWTLVFTMSATRITASQQFTVINYSGNVSTVNTKMSKSLSDAFNKKVFSYEVIEVSEVDVGGNDEYAATLMETRMTTAEGDVIFAPDILAKDYGYKFNGETVYDSYIQRLVRLYGYDLMNLDPEDENGYFKGLEHYLNRYYDGDYVNGELDEVAVRVDFLARIKDNKDKRFKKEAQIEQGLLDEYARIEKYRAGLIEFYGYCDLGVVQFEKMTILDYENGGKVLRDGIYSINVCPDRSKMPGLVDIAAYLQEVEGEDGQTQNVLSADNMHVAFCNFEEVEKGFEYESLLYLNHVIRLSIAEDLLVA